MAAEAYHYPGHHEFVEAAGKEVGLDPDDADDRAMIDQVRNDRQFAMVNTIAGGFYEAPDAETRRAIYREMYKVARAIQLKARAVNAILGTMRGDLDDGGATEAEAAAEAEGHATTFAAPAGFGEPAPAPGPVVKHAEARPAAADPSPTGDQADDADPAHAGADSAGLLGGLGSAPKTKGGKSK